MEKDEKGFFDWLIEDICNTIEIKGAVEATRDENGNVDKWAATGLAMGLGHTSDDEMAVLAGFLGAEGAFDDDSDSDNDYSDDDYDTYTPPIEIDPTPKSTFEHDFAAVEDDGLDIIEEDSEDSLSTEHDSAEEQPPEITTLFEKIEELISSIRDSLNEPDEDEFEDTFIGTNLVRADDMKLLSEAGYDQLTLVLMKPQELKEAMECAGVDMFLYDFD